MLKILDLFSGICGFSYGMEQTGFFKTELFCELDKSAREKIANNFPDIEIFEDIKKLTLGPGDFDVVVGGFPCQDISMAGSRAGISKGSRSSLWKEMLRIINEVGPKYAVIENVEYLRKNGLGIVLNDLARIGYDAEWSCITASSVGYPHQRKRLFIIAYPSGQRFNEHTGKERQLQVNKKRKSKKIHADRKECEFEPVKIREVLSRGFFEKHKSSNPDKQSIVSRIRRVTDGIPTGLDEKQRKERIKQLGNSIVPEIARIIGLAIKEDFLTKKPQE